MIHQTCFCDVNEEKIQDVIQHTQQWIGTLQQEYSEPIHYEAFQDQERPNVVSYFITFTDEENEKDISSKPEPRNFGEKLYSMCKSNPVWKYHDLVVSIRRSQPDSQIHTRVEYRVKPEKIEEVKQQIKDYIKTVGEQEPDIRVYESYQNKDDPSKFIHLAEFKDDIAEKNHKEISHTKKFVEFLYPLCLEEPKFVYLNMIGSARR